MLIIDLKNEKNIETALKTLKHKVQRTKLVQQLRERKEYIKPSVKKRDEILKAIFTEKIKKWS